MGSENAERIRLAYEEFARTRELDLEGFAPDAEWHTAEDLPDSGVHRGHAGISSLVRGWAESFESFRADLVELIDRDDVIVASVVLRGRLRGSAEEVALPETHVWTLRDGLVAEVREYRTLEQALEAAGESRAKP